MFKSGKLFKRQIHSIPKLLSSGSAIGKIEEQTDIFSLIPPRIKRSPTDILKALSGTVGRDPTAFHYQIPDDPFIYPLSNFQKKKRLLAIESGRKSARWIVENNPGFFSHNLAAPSIQTFLNKPVFDENSEVTEETLVGLIQDKSVSQAISVYSLLQNKGVDVSQETKLNLLELLCFYNSSDRQDEQDLWSKWYEMERNKTNFWLKDGLAKTLFNNLEPTCPLAYAALIQGMLKYNNLEEAMELFYAGKDKGIKFPVGVYNLILENAPNLKRDPFERFKAIEEYLKQMANEKIKPNLGTLNSILRTLSRLDGITLQEKESFLCKLFLEFESLGIQPSLGSYYYLLKILVDQNETPRIRFKLAWSVMDCVMKKRWTVQHPSDLFFFQFAMTLFGQNMKSLGLAEALMDFYSDHDHYKFINTNFAELQFFDSYLFLVFTMEPLERSMEVYRKLVPSQIFLEVRRYMTIIKAIIHQKKYEYMEEIWKDMNQYGSNMFPKLSNCISLIMSQISHFKKENTPKYFLEVAEVLFKLLETSDLSPTSLGDVLITFIRFEDEKKVADLINLVVEKQVIFIEHNPLKEAFEFALSKKNIPLIKNCLELAYRENSPQLKAMGKQALPLFYETDKSWLNKILKEVEEQNKRTVEAPNVDP